MLSINDVSAPLEHVAVRAYRGMDDEDRFSLQLSGEQYHGPSPLRFQMELETGDPEVLVQLHDKLQEEIDRLGLRELAGEG
jgi:hypothetical protein